MNHSINVSHLGNSPEELKQAILDKLHFVRCRTPELATRNDWYVAVSSAMRERMIESWIHGIRKLRHPDTKIVGYLSAEFLMGPQLGNALINLGLHDEVKKAVELLG